MKNQPQITSKSKSTGFTLIEVMVALAVAAIGLLGIASAVTRSVDVADQLEQRVVGGWVGSNRMAELRMARDFNTAGSNSNSQQMGGREWRVVDNYFATEDPNIARIVIEVYLDGNEKMISSNVGYLAKVQ